MSDRGLIYDWYPGEDSPVIDITNSQVGYSLQFSSDDDPNNYPAVPLASVPVVLQAVQNATVPFNGSQIPALPLIQNIPRELQTLWSSQETLGDVFKHDWSHLSLLNSASP